VVAVTYNSNAQESEAGGLPNKRPSWSYTLTPCLLKNKQTKKDVKRNFRRKQRLSRELTW
jgi:hypothetical protein